MDKLASPEAPFTFVFPETRNPSVTGEPSTSMTAGCAFALSKACLQPISSLRSSLTCSVTLRQDAGHETTTLCSNYFRRRFDCTYWCLRDDDTLRSSRACWHVDKLTRRRLDN